MPYIQGYVNTYDELTFHSNSRVENRNLENHFSFRKHNSTCLENVKRKIKLVFFFRESMETLQPNFSSFLVKSCYSTYWEL